MALADAVLFDFHGTLAAGRDAVDQLRFLRPALTEPGLSELAQALTVAGLPGGPYPADVPDGLAEAYAARDTDAALHRTAYEGLMTPVAGPELTGELYDLVRGPDGWVAYADAHEVLDALRARGVPIGVITNVGFDLLPVARGLGILERVDTWTSSLDVGAIKPDPELFRAAVATLGVAPERCLVVGDNPLADAGGVPLGMPTLLLAMSPPGSTHGLEAVLGLVGAR